ncbi:hypothetical protein SPRG_03913 [Saprolegnia parasitica CBS 223.65]|uniref:Ubiquitin-like domain-containing protein n=1 Tax=Saprolegnia parasitica (strain CBS 223.65) TaxID=695850 RepID=A0A067CWX3_SAPPC|nr:hypothetical protein SPRG_03913 [Saprolegnia parasitica CBS 223.65]KDO31297.1 hypothetical protein SPRG_03913 [Saprolegnia parasitica CBS 223.65]|eukprot:XP_012197896.1 hypothetical protein SPRG_03913 [Saprolegnia parasitica CBS 223.65]
MAAPYARVLSATEKAKVDALATRLIDLDDTYHFWIRDGNDARSARLRDGFAMRWHSALPIAEIRDQIQERYAMAGHYDDAVDPPLRLLLGGKVLEDGRKLAEYLPLKTPYNMQHLRWAKPYAGVIWVAPLEVEAQFEKKWGHYVAPNA